MPDPDVCPQVAAELAATRYPHLPCVNQRSFSSLAAAAASTIGLDGSAACVAVVRLVLSLAFSHAPWRPPLETHIHWARLPAGNKLLIFHPSDHVIGHNAALHTALEQRRGALDGTVVVQLGGRPRDAHNEDPAQFSPHEWAQAIQWMRAALGLLDPATSPSGGSIPARRSAASARGSTSGC